MMKRYIELKKKIILFLLIILAIPLIPNCTELNHNKIYALSLEERLEALENKQLPIGYIYISKTATNPSTIYGGTWKRIANGKCLVTIDSNDSDFNKVGKTGGEKKTSLSIEQIPSHSHTGTTSESSTHSHKFKWSHSYNELTGGFSTKGVQSNGGYYTGRIAIIGRSSTSSSSGNHTHSFTTNNTGQGFSHNNMQPYYTAYIWEKIG